MNFKYLLVATIALLNYNAIAQSITPSVINSTGGTATVGNLVVDWNVGESMITTQTNGFIVTNGQLQPIDAIISIEELNSSWNVSVYPNPTRDEFVITAPNAGIYEASLFDLAGKFISKQTLMSTNRMDVRSLANGSYYLQVRNTASQEFKTITLIKAIGKVIYKSKIQSTNEIIQLEYFNNGNYIVKVNEVVKRFVVQH